MNSQKLNIVHDIYQEYTTLKRFKKLNARYLKTSYIIEVNRQIAELKELLNSEIDYCITDNQLYQDLTHSFNKN